jgi:Uma2 family endonuclease
MIAAKKFELYKEITALRDYVVVEQDRVLVEVHRHGSGGSWELRSYTDTNDSLLFPSLDLAVPLREVYRLVFS